MLKNIMIESLQEIKEVLEDNNFKKTTWEQRDILKKNFNRSMNFEYVEDGAYIFLMENEDFKSFEYYMGMEYERNRIEAKIQLDENTLVIYSYDCKRAEKIFDLLESSLKED